MGERCGQSRLEHYIKTHQVKQGAKIMTYFRGQSEAICNIR